MTPNRHDLTAARARIDDSRAQFFGTLSEVQSRLRPSNIAQDALEGAAMGVATVARNGARAARSKPLVTAGVVGLIGLFLSRGWIRNIVRRRHETPAPSGGLKPKGSKGTSA